MPTTTPTAATATYTGKLLAEAEGGKKSPVRNAFIAAGTLSVPPGTLFLLVPGGKGVADNVNAVLMALFKSLVLSML
jgi:hypothetical protein